MKERQKIDTEKHALRRAAKADAYESSFQPKKDYKAMLEKDKHRNRLSRDMESMEKKKVRREKDINCHRKQRDLLTETEKSKMNHERKVQTRWKREENKRQDAKKWLDIHRQNNLKKLRVAGSYIKFLWSGEPRTSFYGKSLVPIRNLDEFKWLQNNASQQSLMSSEFITLSKKYACLFNEYGLSSDDVIHIIVENHNHVFGALGGMWIIGGIIPNTTIG